MAPLCGTPSRRARDRAVGHIRRHITDAVAEAARNDSLGKGHAHERFRSAVVFDFDGCLSSGNGGRPCESVTSLWRDMYLLFSINGEPVPLIITARTPRARPIIKQWFAENSLPFQDDLLALRSNPSATPRTSKRVARVKLEDEHRCRVIASIGDRAHDVVDDEWCMQYIDSRTPHLTAPTTQLLLGLLYPGYFSVARGSYKGAVMPSARSTRKIGATVAATIASWTGTDSADSADSADSTTNSTTTTATPVCRAGHVSIRRRSPATPNTPPRSRLQGFRPTQTLGTEGRHPPRPPPPRRLVLVHLFRCWFHRHQSLRRSADEPSNIPNPPNPPPLDDARSTRMHSLIGAFADARGDPGDPDHAAADLARCACAEAAEGVVVVEGAEGGVEGAEVVP